ncbi:hypothetical protein SPFL3102_01180 [Sporomusaceae bacterium FL31]|nr:hypothetical protein SPFL3101_00211 [Sporomusaceae bacterium FL31]GCE33375.1 hypothetical protein SPFL3102_01180 [Sporomusaceae bacterium]
MLKHVRNEKGFILTDSIIGLVIVATALCALIATYTQTTKASISTTSSTYATYLAQRTLEDIKQSDGKLTITLPAPRTETKGSVQYTVSVSEVAVTAIANANNLNANLRPIQAIVTWIESGQNRSLSMMSYYYIQ